MHATKRLLLLARPDPWARSIRDRGCGRRDRPDQVRATYTIGDINGQQGWSKTGAYDVAVANVASFPALPVRLRHPGAAHLGRSHERKLRRPDVLARPREPGRREPGLKRFDVELPDRHRRMAP